MAGDYSVCSKVSNTYLRESCYSLKKQNADLPHSEGLQYCKDTDGGKNFKEQGKTYTCTEFSNGLTTCSEPKIDSCEWCTGACIEGQPCEVFCGAVNEYYCEDGEIESVTKQCEYGCRNGACIEETRECIGEGKKGSMLNNDACCEGLSRISNSFVSGNNCIAPTDGSFVCTQCGNGACGRGENKCNCPIDCQGSEEEVIVEISPDSQRIKEGEKAVYKIKIIDNHPQLYCGASEDMVAGCGIAYYTYNIKVEGLPFAVSHDRNVRIRAGESKTIELVVNPNEPLIYGIQEGEVTDSATIGASAEKYVQPNIVIGKVYSFQVHVKSEEDSNAQAKDKAQLVVEKVDNDYIDVFIEPKSQSIKYGDYAKYEVTVADKHPVPVCPKGMECMIAPYTYQINVNNLPFAKEYPKEITVFAGAEESFTLMVKPYDIVEDWPVVVQETVESVAITKAVSTTGQATESAAISTIQEEDDTGSISIPNYYEREYKFSVTASLNRKVMDTAYAVLKIKPRDPPIRPPPFPTEEVKIQLNKGWNLISLPGKLVSFEKNGLKQKLLGFVYLKDEQKYVTMQDAQEILGDGFKEYLATNAFWVYSYEDYTLKGKVNKEISFDIKLNPEWNLVPITEDMVGGYLSDLKGDCEFEKIYRWRAELQSWDAIDESFVFSNSDVNEGIIVKASDYCTMAGATISLAPPAMPE